MMYDSVIKGVFLRRPNRLVAEVDVDGRVEICHVKNTGRWRGAAEAAARGHKK